MQMNAITPAEHLLGRLQTAEKFSAAYNVVVEKREAYTCLHLRFSLPEYEASLLKPAEHKAGV